ncbi:MAG: GNAT family N-acetyltransferase [Alphaproteobacteria bacterium]|nr:GNAT family N-acetyltransferase [Alphaproteobacteria bacterium]MBN2675225.1 GNAT family N-acetyltransferase [Alphaproteobacteria bacterium]
MPEFIKTIEEIDKDYFYVKIDFVDNEIECATLIGKIENDSAKICKLKTEKKYQFKGIGRKLVKEFELIAKSKSCKKIELVSSDTESDKFWNKMDSFSPESSSMFIKNLINSDYHN